MNILSILFSAVLLAAGTSVAMAQGPSDAQIAAIVVTANQVTSTSASLRRPRPTPPTSRPLPGRW